MTVGLSNPRINGTLGLSVHYRIRYSEVLLHKPLLWIADLRDADKEPRFVIRQTDRRVLVGRREVVVRRFDPGP